MKQLVDGAPVHDTYHLQKVLKSSYDSGWDVYVHMIETKGQLLSSESNLLKYFSY